MRYKGCTHRWCLHAGVKCLFLASVMAGSAFLLSFAAVQAEPAVELQNAPVKIQAATSSAQAVAAPPCNVEEAERSSSRAGGEHDHAQRNPDQGINVGAAEAEAEDDNATSPDAHTMVVAPSPDIEVRAIQEPSIAGLGTLDPQQAGLAPNLWRGSKSLVLAEHLERIRVGMPLDAMRDLLRRTLLVNAEMPATVAEPAASAASTTKAPMVGCVMTAAPASLMVQLRVQALLALGLEEEAQALIAAVPERNQTRVLKEKNAFLQLLQGEWEAACHTAENAAYDTSFWQGLTVFCQAKQGRLDDAELGLRLMQEEHSSDEPWLREMVAQLRDSSHTPRVPAMRGGVSELQLAILPLLPEWDVPHALLEQAPLAVWKAIGRNSQFPPLLRAEALERALTHGVGDVAALQLAYEGVELSEAQLTQPLVEIPATLTGRAQLYQRLEAAAESEAKLSVLMRTFDVYAESNLRFVAYRMYAPVLQTLAKSGLPHNDDAKLAAKDAWLALMLQRDMAAAAQWRVLMDARYATAMAQLHAVLAALVQEENSVPLASAETLDKGQFPPDQQRRIYRLKHMLQALSLKADAASATSSEDVSTTKSAAEEEKPFVREPVPAALLTRFATAVEQHQQGEAVLIAARILASGDIARMDEDALAALLRGLAAVGLAADARALAYELVLRCE